MLLCVRGSALIAVEGALFLQMQGHRVCIVEDEEGLAHDTHEVWGAHYEQVLRSRKIARVRHVEAIEEPWIKATIIVPSDFLGGGTVGTLSGIAGMAAKLTGFVLTLLVPILTAGANYAPVFILGSALALTAIAAIWLLCGTIKPLNPKAATS
mgnify:CR=1 FL=1